MYCPKCAQPLTSDESPFCSRCGLALSDLKRMLAGGGGAHALSPEAAEAALSPRQRGVRQGVTLMLLSLVLVPAYFLLAALFPAEDRLIESSPSDTVFEKVAQAVLFTIFMSGMARLLYARLFQQGAARAGARDEAGDEAGEEGGPGRLKGVASGYELPPAQGIPVSGFGSWRVDTGEMAERPSVRKRTTRSLEQE